MNKGRRGFLKLLGFGAAAAAVAPAKACNDLIHSETKRLEKERKKKHRIFYADKEVKIEGTPEQERLWREQQARVDEANKYLKVHEYASRGELPPVIGCSGAFVPEMCHSHYIPPSGVIGGGVCIGPEAAYFERSHPRRFTKCSYCGTTWNLDKQSSCPNCGAN